jgi:ubiquinone/menaquinone biosynthesis C-methylase UbiE
MADPVGMGLQLAGNAVRFGWYSGVNWMLGREARRYGKRPPYTPSRPVPTQAELMADLRALLVRDAVAVGKGLLPPASDETSLPDHLDRVRAMFADLARREPRRLAGSATSARELPDAEGLPEYFTQDFHYQTGGYLSEDSARLYDVQVETLFYGAAAAMRRAAIPSIAEFLAGRDQRRIELLDVACGTGRFLRQLRLAFPAIRAKGLDLSRAYLAEARRHLDGLRPVEFVAGNAERLPFADASQDVVTTIYLYHELPAEVRRRVTAEIARVLKPGGLFVFVDSLQFGDRPEWDGLLEAFPVRYHEPYYRHYLVDDLEGLFAGHGLAGGATSTAFLSKIMVRQKRGVPPP